MTQPPRHFPPPWDIEETNKSCFIVRDHNGQAVAYVYFEKEPGRRTAAGLLTRDEARRIAGALTRLSDLLRKGWHRHLIHINTSLTGTVMVLVGPGKVRTTADDRAAH
jgi:hypothetical protein